MTRRWLAGSQGNFELNAMRPVIISNFLHSARILGDGCEKFRMYSVEGTQLNERKIAEYLGNSLSKIAHKAHRDGSTLRDAAIATGLITPEMFDKVVIPAKMVGDTSVSFPTEPAATVEDPRFVE